MQVSGAGPGTLFIGGHVSILETVSLYLCMYRLTCGTRLGVGLAILLSVRNKYLSTEMEYKELRMSINQGRNRCKSQERLKNNK